MKNMIIGALVAFLVVGAVGGIYVATVSAQTQTPPEQPLPFGGRFMGRGMMGNYRTDDGGLMHDTMIALFAEKTGLSVEVLEEKLSEGQTMVEIATEAGLTVEDVTALMVETRNTALADAVTSGTITQEQADWMQARMNGRFAGGQAGEMPCFNGSNSGQRPMMPFGRGGRWTAPDTGE